MESSYRASSGSVGHMANDRHLRSEIRMLGETLGEVLCEQAGDAALDLVEDIRALAKSRRRGDRTAHQALAQRIRALNHAQLVSLIQALSVFFDLANLAEERHRVRVIRERQRKGSSPGTERLHDVLMLLRRAKVSADQVQSLLNQLTVDFVFTAHPTEAKRRSIREKVRDLREHLSELDASDLPPRDRARLMLRIKADLTGLWQTDFVRFRRPSVLEELDRSLFFAGNLWNVTPALHRDLKDALAEQFPGRAFEVPSLLRFGTWIGGDRDGNPNVTADVTRRALTTLRHQALTRHIDQARMIRRHLSMSTRKVAIGAALTAAIESCLARWPALLERVAHLSESEPYRRWLRVVQWRLEQSLQAELTGELPEGAYVGSDAFSADLRVMRDSLCANRAALIAQAHLDDWICQADVFGFHLMRLDIRQESSWYHQVVGELLSQAGCEGYAEGDEATRQRAFTSPLELKLELDDQRLSEQARETLTLFSLLAEVSGKSGSQSLGAHIVSMTHQPSDVLAVLWLSQWAARRANLPDGRLAMPIAPLFETIDDLRNATATLDAMLHNPMYRDHVRALGDRQIVMIGYSDSTKDGGYLAACWQLHHAQVEMQRIAAKHGVQIIFFHGRGGSLGRGGGPAARSILSLPPNTLTAGLRMTEQGEVLSERYDDPHIAHRHLEQVLSATLAAASGAGATSSPVRDASHMLDSMAAHSHRIYRELVDHDGFMTYFEQATPITQIEQLPIGSRPSRRRAERSLTTLRAIPWVFSWTQCRHMIPAWYGLGSALEEILNKAQGKKALQSLYRNDLFFRATIENAALALAKADMGIAKVHAELVDDTRIRSDIWTRISAEYRRTRRAVLQLTGRRQLLGDIPWLKRSIDVRNPYVDPLNFIQVELFHRWRNAPENTADATELADLIRLTIQGIAGGLRTTG